MREEKQEIKDNFDCQQTVYLDLSKIIKEQADELKTAKFEAIKEFTEKLKKRFYLLNGRCVVNIPQIDNLVEEMTENDFKEE